MNKDGVSAVVATVLIVMITVAAVGLLWAIVSPFLKSNIADKTACVEAEMSITLDSASKYTCVSEENGTAVRVSRGNDDNVWKSVQVVYTDSFGNSDKVSYAYPPEKNSDTVYRNINMTDVVRISVLPILEGDGDGLVCSKTVELASVRNCSGEVEASIGKTSSFYCGEDLLGYSSVCLEGVVLYWPFDKDSNDYSGNEIYGTQNGGATISDNFLSVDGVDDSVTGSVALSQDDMSVSFWVKFDELPSGNPRLLNYGWDGSEAAIFAAYGSAKTFVFERKTSSGNYGAGYNVMDYVTGKWYHIIGSYDSTSRLSRIYIDGVLKGGGGAALGFPGNTGVVNVAHDGGTGYFNGFIDEVMIFNRVVTAEEVTDIYSVGR